MNRTSKIAGEVELHIGAEKDAKLLFVDVLL
jgi:hypothetical protein